MLEDNEQCKKCFHYQVCANVLKQQLFIRKEMLHEENPECKHFISAADVVEVRHDEWLLKSRIYKMPDDFDEEFYVECPFCQRTFYVPFEFEKEKMLAYAKENYPYCNCGAKMDGKDDSSE